MGVTIMTGAKEVHSWRRTGWMDGWMDKSTTDGVDGGFVNKPVKFFIFSAANIV